jgi:hypothetical protein
MLVIIGLSICAVLSGCNEWSEIELYGEHKEQWLNPNYAIEYFSSFNIR